MITVNVDLPGQNYPIYIGNGLLGNPKLLASVVAGRKLLIVTNDVVGPLYLERARAMLGPNSTDTLILPDGEKYKSLETVSLIYDKLLKNRYDRSAMLIALGGGVIGDITGFAAATYQRGIGFIQIPTTLLAQVDSSVGGKTGVNHPLGKNMIGAFYQPKAVIADTSLLGTLPDRELKAGLAEVIKYGLLGDAEFFQWLDENSAALLGKDERVLAKAVKISCEHKAAIVAQDERESGVRALLNLGHTFGHAIETATGYTQWLHGEAVAVGMVMAADLSMRMGWIDAADAKKIKSLIEKFGMPVVPPADITEERYLSLMSSDKKVSAGKIRFILLKAIGRAVIASDVDSSKLSSTLRAGTKLCHLAA